MHTFFWPPVRLVFGLLLAAAAQILPAQAPLSVTQALGRAFAGADSIVWTTPVAGVWEARFRLAADALTAQFDTTGRLCIWRKKIRFAELPEQVRVSFARDRYADTRIDNVSQITLEGNPSRYFLIEASTTLSRIPFRFLPNGYRADNIKPRCACSIW